MPDKHEVGGSSPLGPTKHKGFKSVLSASEGSQGSKAKEACVQKASDQK